MNYGTRTGNENEKLGGLCEGNRGRRSTLSGDYVLCETEAASKLDQSTREFVLVILLSVCVNKFSENQTAFTLFVNFGILI